MNYAKFRKDNNMTNADMVAVLHEVYPGYSKIQQSMIQKPETYGVGLIPAAEKVLKDWADTYIPKKRDRRKKGNRLYLRLDDALYREVRAIMEEMGYTTVQNFLEDALISIVESRREGTA